MPQLNARLVADLLDRHGPALKLYARQWCADPDDCVQQALIDIAACRELPTSPAAWLFTAVRRRAISQSRSNRSRQHHEQIAATNWFKRVEQHQADTEAAIDALGELPLADREIVIAHLWGRLTFAEIGELTNISHSTAQRRYEAAIERLKERLNRERTNTPCPKTET
jgi:RNA polymerase sigma factor (sigma-70 family)